MLVVCAAFLAVVAVEVLVVAHLIRRRADVLREQQSAGVVDRVRAARGVVVHPSCAGDEAIEYPVHPDFGADDVLDTLAEIEEL